MIKYMISLDNILKLGSNFVFNIEVDELKEVMIFLEFWVQVCDLDELFEVFFLVVLEMIQDKVYVIIYKF